MLRFDFSALGGTEGAASTPEKSDNSHVKGYEKNEDGDRGQN